MSPQADFIVSNGTGAAVRSDLNVQFAAIVSNNSGATEPATMYAYQWWADTTAGLLKLRNSANSAWITMRQLDGEFSTVPVENGSAAAPSIYFKDSGTDSGFFSPGTDAVAISTAGTNRLHITSGGLVGIGTSTPSTPLHIQVSRTSSTNAVCLTLSDNVTGGQTDGVYKAIRSKSNNGASESEIRFLETSGANNDTGIAFATQVSAGALAERMRIDELGRVGVGTASPQSLLHLETDGTALRIVRGSAIGFAYHTGTAATDAFRIQSNGGSVDLYSAAGQPITFTAATTEKARIDSSGRLLVGTSTARSNIQLSTGFGSVTPNHQFETSATTYAGLSLINNSTGYPAVFSLGKSRSAGGIGSNGIVASGDIVGMINFYGNDGTNFVRAATITAEVDGTPGANDMPGRLTFSTTADGASSPTARVIIDQAGRLKAQGVYDNTTAAAANVWVDTDGSLRRSTSSIKYKTNIETLEDSYADAILQVRPVWYKSLSSADNPAHGWWGFIAEEVAQIDPRLVQWKTSETKPDENGSLVSTELEKPEPEGVAYDRFVPHLLNLIKRQGEAIADLQAEVAALKAQ
jgi:hypothetical protein